MAGNGKERTYKLFNSDGKYFKEITIPSFIIQDIEVIKVEDRYFRRGFGRNDYSEVFLHEVKDSVPVKSAPQVPPAQVLTDEKKPTARNNAINKDTARASELDSLRW
jgi:hypothetical protein